MPARAKGRSRGGPHRPGRPKGLPASALRWTCRPSEPALTSGARAQSLIGIIGQERAIRALRLGIRLYGPGYNVFVCGITGTGRASTVQKILDRIKHSCPLPPDRCYVHNFSRPDEPRLLELPRGFGHRFRSDMRRFAREVQEGVASILESQGIGRKRDRVMKRYEGEGDRLIERFESRSAKEGFALKRVRDGQVSRPELFPVVQGQAVPLTDLEKMVQEGKVPQARAERLIRSYQDLRQSLESTARRSRELLSKMETEITDLERHEVRTHLEDRIGRMVEGYPPEARGRLRGWLSEALEDVVLHVDLLRRALDRAKDESGEPSEPPPETARDGSTQLTRQGLLDRLRVHLVYDARRHAECPVIVETHPTYRRLFGYFERTLHVSGFWSTDFTRIRPGSLLQADGGYLVVTAEDLFSQRDIWMELKRSLINRSLAIMDENSGLAGPSVSMRPEPIPINVKVIMIGQRDSYEHLMENEPDFRKIFKVLADFDEEMERSAKTLRQYAGFVRRVCAEEGLGELDAAAIAAVAEYGARLAGRQDKLSTRFGEIADLVREANYWRAEEGSGPRVLARHVRKAAAEATTRAAQIEEKLRDMVKLGQIRIEVKGRRQGQINGLVVHHTGDHAFGLPARITATVSPGTAGLINIEREASLSGRTHTKGMLILGGFLRETFGRHRPLTLTASVAFEQSYGGVEGDSASASEIFALLSALSDAPLDQGLAVTGSVDQKGDIQPVGGINEKIEGFFRVCEIKGLTGRQGVIIPDANRSDLMLDDAVVDAVRGGRFHVYPVQHVSEAMEILTGVPAGEPDELGRYPEGTLLRRVADRLDRFAEQVRRLGPTLPF
jgi:predicted ATP-dependent protease